MRSELSVNFANPFYRTTLAAASPPHLQGICEQTRVASVGLTALQAARHSYLSSRGRIRRAIAVSKPLLTREVAES